MHKNIKAKLMVRDYKAHFFNVQRFEMRGDYC